MGPWVNGSSGSSFCGTHPSHVLRVLGLWRVFLSDRKSDCTTTLMLLLMSFAISLGKLLPATMALLVFTVIALLHTVSALQLGFKHMSKCGGTDIIALFRRAGIEYTLFGEETGLSAKQKKNTYVIASVRNPCSYTLSLWAYQGGKPWAARQNQAAKTLGIPFWSHTSSNTSSRVYHNSTVGFVDWTRLTMSGGQHSIMAYRFFQTLIAQRDGLACISDRFFRCARDFNDEQVEQGLLSFANFSQVDCWVFLESLCAFPDASETDLSCVGVDQAQCAV